jgi:ArsR family transcriptional regulator, arsenate/arsenite/antimonite-responsive transcriptional repressor
VLPPSGDPRFAPTRASRFASVGRVRGAGVLGQQRPVRGLPPGLAVQLGALGQAEAEQLAAAFKVIADPARLRLLSLLASKPEGEACVCDLVEPLGLSQPTVSHHLKLLHAAGLLAREKRGLWVYYRLIPERLQILRDALGAPSIARPVV